VSIALSDALDSIILRSSIGREGKTGQISQVQLDPNGAFKTQTESIRGSLGKKFFMRSCTHINFPHLCQK
jgi:hypothetical protein